jgi:hypothetical protein
LAKNTLRVVVRIANPVPGGKTCTSAKRALQYLRNREAVLTDAGELFFLTAAIVLARREAARLDAAIAKYRGGKVLWNGSVKDRPGRPAIHGPGEVRS